MDAANLKLTKAALSTARAENKTLRRKVARLTELSIAYRQTIASRDAPGRDYKGEVAALEQQLRETQVPGTHAHQASSPIRSKWS